MRDNYIIGTLTGIATAQTPIWEFDSIWQPILLILFVGFWVAWTKRYLDDEWGCSRAER